MAAQALAANRHPASLHPRIHIPKHMCKPLFLPKQANHHFAPPTTDSVPYHIAVHCLTRPTMSFPHLPSTHPEATISPPPPLKQQPENNQQPSISTISSHCPPSFSLRPIDFKLAKFFTNHNIFIIKLIDSNRRGPDFAAPFSLNCECRLSVSHSNTA